MNRITAGMAIGILIATLNGCEALKELDDAMYELTYGVKPPTAAKKKPEKPMPPECQNLEARYLELIRKRPKPLRQDDIRKKLGEDYIRKEREQVRKERAQGKSEQEIKKRVMKSLKKRLGNASEKFSDEVEEVVWRVRLCTMIRLHRNLYRQ